MEEDKLFKIVNVLLKFEFEETAGDLLNEITSRVLNVLIEEIGDVLNKMVLDYELVKTQHQLPQANSMQNLIKD